MKKFVMLAYGIFTLIAVLNVAAPTFAQANLTPEICSRVYASEDDKPTVCKEIESTADKNPLYGKDGILSRAIIILSFLVGIISVIIVIIAGINLAMSDGEPDKVTRAKNQIIYAVIGVVVALSAQLMVRFLLNRIGV